MFLSGYVGKFLDLGFVAPRVKRSQLCNLVGEIFAHPRWENDVGCAGGRSKVYIYIPRTPMTSIFEGQPPKTRPFPFKTRVIWVLGIYT